MESLSSGNRKTLTNLADEPQINVTQFEPITSDTYDLGSSTFRWNDVYVNKISQKGFPLETIVPNAYGSLLANTSPPADLASNGGMEYFVNAVSSSNFRIWRYFSTTGAATQIFPPAGFIVFYTLASGTGNSFLALYNGSTWVRIAMNTA